MTKIREGYKETEIGVIPEDWEVDILSSFSIKIGDGLHGTPKYTDEGKYYFVNGNNLKDGKITFTDETKRVDEEEYLKYKVDLRDSSILISMNGTIGSLALYNYERIMLGKSAGYITLQENVSKEYIFQVLQTKYVKDFINKELTGTTIRNLSLKTLRNIPIVFGSLTEQQRIAEILSTTDEHIEKLDKTIEDYQLLKKGMMKKLLTEGIGHTEFKDTEIGRIPREWEVNTLGEISEYRRGSFPQPYGKHEWYDDENGYPFVQVYDVDDNFKLKTTTKRKISKVATEMSVFAEKGTILVTLQGSIGKTAMAQYDTYVDRTLLLFTKFKVDFDSRYFMYVIDALFNIEKNKADGGVIKTITKETLTKFLIPIPLIDEQKIIAETLESVSTTLSLLLQEQQDFIQLKKALMEKLLTGKIRTI